ncbi:Pentatricopeptide repeat-containing protein [Platanthera guangdongensis]|uniref:Pentatricopeptide repeat-containing protein n=1 Tax=Platanthera guangdongensis TaxID=2320717 RepID=A0ABR2MUQ3_9ASPA
MRLSPFLPILSTRWYACYAGALTAPALGSPPPANINLYISLLNRCAEQRSISQTRRVHLHMNQTGFPHLSLGNKLVVAYLNSGDVDDARQVFDEMPNPHIVTWNAMISSYIRHKRILEAVSMYKLMLVKRIHPDEFTFSTTFRAFSGMRLINGGRAVHGHLVVLGLQSKNLHVSSALVDLYSKFGRLREAHIVYDAVDVKDVVLATALIVGYTQNGEDGEALGVFGEMVNSGIKANDFTFASILIACANLKDLFSGRMIHGAILKSEFCSNIAPRTSLLSLYSNSGLIEDSMKIFSEIVNPNTVAWTAIIGCLLNSHREEDALSMFRSMIFSSESPNAFTLSTTLAACSSLALLNQGKLIHAYALKTGLDTNRFVISALVDTYGKCGQIGLARMVFDSAIVPDLVSLNSLIYGYAQNGNGVEAVRLFHMMQSLGLGPNDATYVNTLSACSKSGMIDEGRRIFSSMVADHKSEPSNDHYACMVDLLGRAGRLEEAKELLAKAQKPDKVVWRALLGASKIHGEVEMAKWAAKKVLELDPGDDGTYVLLSNMYASLGQWEEVIKMKCLMREKGLKKEDPAVSWIHVDRAVHSFTAGDRSHPKGVMIYDELERLIEKTKGMGYVPDTRFVLHEMDELERDEPLFYHSEKLAVAFGVLSGRGKAYEPITIFKNLRVCVDCHNWMKLVSKLIGKEIIARDAKRYHCYRDGLCSCGDYW